MVRRKIENLCNQFKLASFTIQKLKGDGSDRQIFRINCATDQSKSYIAVYGNNIEENRAFLSFLQTFKENGFKVPILYHTTVDFSCYLLEDLGDSTIKSVSDRLYSQNKQNELEDYYCRIIKILPEIQVGLKDKIDYNFCYQSKIFDKEAMSYDIRRFTKYYLIRHLSIPENRLEDFNKKISLLIELLLQSDNSYFMYRDFQTRNMMLKNGEIYFIDFQSGRKGALQYDLASFIYSSGTYMNDDLEKRLIDLYLDKLSALIKVDKEQFKLYLYGFGIIRILQAMGGYAFLYYEKDKKEYLKKVPVALKRLKILCKRLNIDLSEIYD